MKKRVTLILFMIMFCFVSIDNLQAKSTYSCNKEVPVDGYITCSVTVDNDAVKIESDGNVNIYDLKGEKYSKISDYQAVFYESGTVVFGPADDKYSKYIISLLTEDGRPYGSDTRVNVIAKTTVKPTTTTTTKSLSSNNYLSTITVDGEEIENFSKNTSKYFVKVENDVSTISIEAEAEDEKAKVEIDGPDTLKIGDNEYTISVTSENDTTKFYKVIVTRKEEDESSNTDIDNIKVKGYNLNFDKNSKTFYLSINKNTTKLNIEVTLDDDKSNYEIKGNENLKDGSIVKIIVTAEDGSTDTYRIIIQKDSKSNVPLIIILISSIIIIGIVVFVLIKRKNKNKKNDKKGKTAQNNQKLNSSIENKAYQDEKTIEMPPISADSASLDGYKEDDDEQIVHVDNDEEEKTRMLSYAEKVELEKNVDENEKIKNMINDELDKTFTNSDDI